MIVTRDQVPQVVKQTIVDVGVPFDVDVSSESRLVEDLNFDSLDFVDFAVSIENIIGKDISDDELADAKTVGDLISIIERKFD